MKCAECGEITGRCTHCLNVSSGVGTMSEKKTCPECQGDKYILLRTVVPWWYRWLCGRVVMPCLKCGAVGEVDA